MIGKVIEGRYAGASVNKLLDKNILFVVTDDGDKVALSKSNVISIDDVTDQYPHYGRKVLMVIWNDFETSIIQLRMANPTVASNGNSHEETELNEKPRKEDRMKKKHKRILIVALFAVFTFLIAILLSSSLSFLFSKECAYCNGDGLLICDICKETGSLVCTTCDNGNMTCNDCSGDGTIGCHNCYGKGYKYDNVCNTCKGKGSITTPFSLSDYASSESEAVRNLYPNARKNSNGTWEYDCIKCKGIGYERKNCSICEAKGYLFCETCDSLGNTGNCPVCHGTTLLECSNCVGEGMTSCEKCQGLGKHFLWS